MDSTSLKCWRAALAVILTGEASVLAYAAWSLQRYKPITDGNPLLLWLASTPLPLGLVYVATLVALFRFLGSSGRLAWGVAAVVGMKTIYEVFATIYSAHHQDFFQVGVVLLGLLIGEIYAYLIGVRAERSEQEWLTAKAFGCTAAIAVFGASYVSAGTGKLIYGGFDWVESSTIRLMVLSHTEIGTGALKDTLGHWIAANRALCAMLQIGTIVIQVGAFALIIGPRMRTLWATLIVCFHLGIYVSSNILFLQPLLFAAVLAFPWPWVARRLWSVQPVTVDLETPAIWHATADSVTAGRRTWLKMTASVVAVLWLVTPHVVHAAHWRALSDALRRLVGLT